MEDSYLDSRDGDNQSIDSMDERKGCRSLLCDANGIIIAEMVYRCMRCYSIHDFIGDVSKHYHSTHMNEDEDQENEIKEEEEGEEEDICNNNYINDYSNNRDEVAVWQIDSKQTYNEKYRSSRKPSALVKYSISNHHKSPNTSSESCTRSGYITCPVCSTTRCYTTLQRRYGQFTCVACYRFFKEFFMKPTRYTCPYLGSCSLDVKTKCKACWILACIKVYTVDGRRKSILEAHIPMKAGCKQSTPKTNSKIFLNDNSKLKSSNGLHSSIHISNSNSNSNSFLISKENDFDPMEQESSLLVNENGLSHGQDVENETCNEKDLLMLENGYDKMNNSSNSNNNLNNNTNEKINNEMVLSQPSEELTSGNKSISKTRIERRSKARVKNWCCLKCANCLADDCGKCINCLDRPKFGGPFIRKQRCVNKKCLEKIHSDPK